MPCPTCATCRWWKTPPAWSDTKEYSREREVIQPADPDTWEPMAAAFEVRLCASPRLLFYERPMERNGASLVDGSEYRASLATGPDFGCALHEPA